MKRNAVAMMIKDILFAAIAWGIGAFLINGMWGVEWGGTLSVSEANMAALIFAGIPFGWRWASKLITAVSIKGIFIKLGIAFVLGLIAFFVVLIGDVIYLVAHFVKMGARNKQTANHSRANAPRRVVEAQH